MESSRSLFILYVSSRNIYLGIDVTPSILSKLFMGSMRASFKFSHRIGAEIVSFVDRLGEPLISEQANQPPVNKKL